MAVDGINKWKPSQKAGGIPSVSTRFNLSVENEQTDAGRGTAEPISRDQNLRRERGQGNIHVPCSAATTSRISNLTRLIYTSAM